MADHMYSAEEAAQVLGLQVRTVRNYVREGQLPGVRIGKQYRIARADLEAFIGGGGREDGGSVQVDAPVPRPAAPVAEVSSVVQIDGIAEPSRDRLERTLAAAALAATTVSGTEADAAALRVEPFYDGERQRLKLIIVGGLGDTAELLRVIERLSLERD